MAVPGSNPLTAGVKIKPSNRCLFLSESAILNICSWSAILEKTIRKEQPKLEEYSGLEPERTKSIQANVVGLKPVCSISVFSILLLR